jgi:hypothetical protein
VKPGDEMNGFLAERRCQTWADVEDWLTGTARSEARTGLLPPGRGLKRVGGGHMRTYEELTVNVESVSPALVPNCAGVRAGRRFHPRCPLLPAILFTAARPAVSYPRNCLISFVSLRGSNPRCRRERAGSGSIGGPITAQPAESHGRVSAMLPRRAVEPATIPQLESWTAA